MVKFLLFAIHKGLCRYACDCYSSWYGTRNTCNYPNDGVIANLDGILVCPIEDNCNRVRVSSDPMSN